MKSIEERVAEIKDKHTRGYNCAQIVLCSYAEELGIDEETLFRISEGFGAGMGGMMQTCGASDCDVYGTWTGKQFRRSAGL